MFLFLQSLCEVFFVLVSICSNSFWLFRVFSSSTFVIFFYVSICATPSFFLVAILLDFNFFCCNIFHLHRCFFIFIVCNTLYSFYCVFVAFYYIIGSSQLFRFVSIFTYILLLDVSFLGFYFLVLLHCRFDSLNFIFIFFFFFQFKHL